MIKQIIFRLNIDNNKGNIIMLIFRQLLIKTEDKSVILGMSNVKICDITVKPA